MYLNLAGNWAVRIDDGKEYSVALPGTLDESKVGHEDDTLVTDQGRGTKKAEGPIFTRLTRKYSYTGAARYRKNLEDFSGSFGDINVGKVLASERVFIKVERSRALFLEIDGEKVAPVCGTLSTPYIFDVTGKIRSDSKVEFICDNSYPDMPKPGIIYSSAATDETQTNWNGLIGEISLFTKEKAFVYDLRVYPKGNRAVVSACINAYNNFSGKFVLECEAFENREKAFEIDLDDDGPSSVFFTVPLKADVKKWDEYEGNMYNCVAKLTDETGQLVDEKEISFGIRDFGYDKDGRLTINGRRFFLRGEANCAEFPETGHWPMDVDSWITIMEKYKSYGINMVRFHSHCPPEAAFIAADKAGMMLQPELSHWNPTDAFLSEESVSYYEKELREIILTYANHPSFVMFSLGNELSCEEKTVAQMTRLVNLAKEMDDTRLFAWGSNVGYGEKGVHMESDFYTSMGYFKDMLRATSPGMIGHLNNRYPSADYNYTEVTDRIREVYNKPVFGFEVGQYEVLPDFNELDEFNGVTDPVNLKLVKEHAKEAGILDEWDSYVKASGEISRMCYKEEVEAVLRTPSMSGLSLLGIQDFPGQGTALVGMMNSHLNTKKYEFAKPEYFRQFFTSRLPMILLSKYTYFDSELIDSDVVIANYDKEVITGKVCLDVLSEEGRVLKTCVINDNFNGSIGALTNAGKINLKCGELLGDKKAIALTLKVYVKGSSIVNTYPIWIYRDNEVAKPEDVYEARTLDDKAIDVLKNGGIVFLAPDATKEALPKSIKCQFSTDFWCADMFKEQEGAMGQLIEKTHPVFEDFPTREYTQQQWWPMASSRAIILPKKIKAIITEMDCYLYLRPMAQLFEAKCLNGRILLSSLGLHNMQKYPEAKALLNSIYSYLKSRKFAPEQTLSVDDLMSCFD